MLAAFIPETSFTNWHKNIPAVVFAHNTSVHSTLLEIPYFLMFGRDPKLPMDVAMNLPTASSADDMLTRLKRAFENAENNLTNGQVKQKKRFDKNLQEEIYFSTVSPFVRKESQINYNLSVRVHTK